MKIDNLTPDAVILQEFGNRLARHRKQRGFSQTSLAEEAGLGVATLRRIEAGEGSQMESWIKLLKALRMTSSIDQFLPETVASPMVQARAESSPRKRRAASGKRWGDEV
ncbi:MAG: helix-turn-helix transcriptional regulator [Boseongicola sp. SB0667_bin_21]|nr:helix-turn-helix transcriptional regulator [Boseongicola sp.]MXW85326.1 helix-turn-helix transcriptional regulator [Boseongicola sp. SB0667_bin_21]